jgi:hypothetical protein
MLPPSQSNLIVRVGATIARLYNRCIADAEVAELADAPALGAGGRKAVGVRVPSSAFIRSALFSFLIRGLTAPARRSTFAILSAARHMGDTSLSDDITYDIFKDDAIGSPLWIEAVQGLERAMKRMEELAASEESDYYLFCAQAGKIVERKKRKSPQPDDKPCDKSWKMAG